MTHFLTGFTLLLILISLNPVTARAWGSEGHAQVGMLALQGLDPAASAWIDDVLDTGDVGEISRACNWPDKSRICLPGNGVNPSISSISPAAHPIMTGNGIVLMAFA